MAKFAVKTGAVNRVITATPVAILMKNLALNPLKGLLYPQPKSSDGTVVSNSRRMK